MQITQHFFDRFVWPEPMFEVVVLPSRTSGAYGAASLGFQAGDGLAERQCLSKSHKHMDVVRHDDRTAHSPMAVVFEGGDFMLDGGGGFGVGENRPPWLYAQSEEIGCAGQRNPVATERFVAAALWHENGISVGKGASKLAAYGGAR